MRLESTEDGLGQVGHDLPVVGRVPTRGATHDFNGIALGTSLAPSILRCRRQINGTNQGTYSRPNLGKFLDWLFHMDDPITLHILELLHDSRRPSDLDLVSHLGCT